MHFNKAVLTDSPADFNAVQQANITLNNLLDTKEPLPSPAKQFVHHCTRSIMRLHARNTILEKENADQKAILQGRKHPLSGKRRVIHRKHLMTGVELAGIREAEAATRQRKAPKTGTQKQNTRSKVKKESSDESEADTYITDDTEVEILDYIDSS